MPLEFPYNFHTHSVYCDGHATLPEMAKAAYDMGFKGLGFTGHIYDRRAARWSMTEDGCVKYREEIAKLKKEYEGRMTILAGAEADLWTTDDLSPYDFVIGSVHCFYLGGRFIMTDQKVQDLTDTANEFFGGDIYGLLKHFYELEAKVAEMQRVDMIGHLDYVSKFNQMTPLFDENDRRYIEAWQGALDALMPLDVPFEINTSPFYRKRMDRFYPSRPIIEEIFRRGGRISITGDCHGTDNLYQGFPKAIALAKDIGFKKASIFTEKGEEEVGL